MSLIILLIVGHSSGRAVTPVPPTIVEGPRNQVALVGSTTTLSFAGGGDSPFSYQWFFQGMPIAGATNSTLVLDNLTLAMAGSYFVRVTNPVGTAESPPGTLHVRPLVVLANGFLVRYLTFGGYSPITVSFSTSFTNAQIFFTLDGSSPSRDSMPYTGPFSVSTNVTVRAVVYSEDFSQSGEAEPVELLAYPRPDGRVSFRNNDLYVTAAERRVFDAQGRPLVGLHYFAQLYYGPLGTPPASLTPHPALASFRNIPTTDSFAGTWIGGTRTLTGMSDGQTATLQVRVWDQRFGSTFAEAVSNPAPENQYGVSSPFTYQIPVRYHPPPVTNMEGLRGFTLVTNPPSGAPTVSFRNNDVYAIVAERRVFDVQGQPLVGTNYLAQLYYGPLGTAPANLIPHTSAPTRFRNITPTEPFAGTWVGATRTLTGMSLGQTVTLQVRVWDERFGLTFPQAAANPGFHQYGVSCPFSYRIPGPNDPVNASPGANYMHNLRSFNLVTNPPPGVIRIREENGGCLQQVFLGTHNVDATEDLRNWTALGNQTPPFVDIAFTNLPARFYRLHDGNTFSSNIVGYYRLTLCDGFTMIANQLDTGNNLVTNVLRNPPPDTHVYKFNRASGGYDSIAHFSTGWEGDDLNMTLHPGEGAFLAAPSSYTPLFFGDVLLSSSVPLAAGFSIVSSAIPQSLPLTPPTPGAPSLGFPVGDGDTVYLWTCRGTATPSYRTFGYLGGQWEYDVGNFVPRPAIGEAFWLVRTEAGNWTRTFSVGP